MPRVCYFKHLEHAAGDAQLIKWHKQEQPIIPHPPENMKLTGFRDPYIIQKGDGHKKWKMLLGSGIEGQGGTLLVYEASELSSGWSQTAGMPSMLLCCMQQLVIA